MSWIATGTTAVLILMGIPSTGKNHSMGTFRASPGYVETVELVVEKRLSLSRFGDGEFGLLAVASGPLPIH